MNDDELQLSYAKLVSNLGRIYSRFRSSCMNRKYYGRKLRRYKRLDKWLNILVAVGTSTTVAAWSIWKTSIGLNPWTVFVGITTLIAVIKPILNLQSDIERFSKLHAGHTRLYNDLDLLVAEVRTEQSLTPDIFKRFAEADQRYRDLAVDDDLSPSKRLSSKCEEEVRQAFPNSFFWNPPKPLPQERKAPDENLGAKR